MQNAICPVVTTVTSRPYYWVLFTWANYDYYRHEDELKDVFKSADEYIRKTNYFITCGALLNGFREIRNFIGSDSIDGSGVLLHNPVPYNKDYVKGLSTMAYYRAGIAAGEAAMNLVISENVDTGEKYTKPKMSYSGEQLAKAFEKVLQGTVYYQKYRFSTSSVPKEVLMELGQIIRVDLSTLPECRELIKGYLFERDRLRKLQECKNYLDYIYKDTGNDFADRGQLREILFDRYSSQSQANPLPDELKEIAGEWETVVGRHYFTVGLQMIWKYMTEVLSEPMDLQSWIQLSMDDAVAPFDPEQPLELIINQLNLNHEQCEAMAEKARRNISADSVWNGLLLTLMVYNRFHTRADLSERAKSFYYFGSDDSSVSMNQYFEKVEEYKNRPIREFVDYIMQYYIVRQHMETAFMKLIRNNVDGFYIEQIGRQYRRLHVFDFAFQGLRMEQLASVMRDLRCF